VGVVLAGTAGLLAQKAAPFAAEPPPETTTIRLTDKPYICFSPQYVARAEEGAERIGVNPAFATGRW
jgi:hypothetical protein